MLPPSIKTPTRLNGLPKAEPPYAPVPTVHSRKSVCSGVREPPCVKKIGEISIVSLLHCPLQSQKMKTGPIGKPEPCPNWDKKSKPLSISATFHLYALSTANLPQKRWATLFITQAMKPLRQLKRLSHPLGKIPA